MSKAKWLFILILFSILLVAVRIVIYPAKVITPPLTSLEAYCNKCNVILIDIDLLRADALDCIENYNKTPNLCKLLAQSQYFKNNISQSDLSVVNQISTFNSVYPTSHDYWAGEIGTYPKRLIAFPDILRKNGYSSEITDTDVSLNIINGNLWFGWFDKAIDFSSIVSDDKFLPQKKKPFFLYVYSWQLHSPYVKVKDRILAKNGYIPIDFPLNQDEQNEVLARYLADNYKKVFQKKAIEENYSLFSGNLFEKRDEILKLFYGYTKMDVEKFKYIKDHWLPVYNSYFSKIDPNKKEDLWFIKDLYLETLSSIDKQLEPVLNQADSTYLKNNTVVILMSDHGEEFYEHGKFSHQNNLYQELIKTPLLIRIPNFKAKEINAFTENVDIVPTVLKLLGLEVPDQVQGKNLAPLILNTSTSVKDYQIAQKGEDDHVASFRKGDMKLIIFEGKPSELYNLSDDSGEKNNLIDSETVIAKNLYQSYLEFINSLPKYGSSDKSLPSFIDDKKRQKLKDEGYF